MDSVRLHTFRKAIIERRVEKRGSSKVFRHSVARANRRSPGRSEDVLVEDRLYPNVGQGVVLPSSRRTAECLWVKMTER